MASASENTSRPQPFSADIGVRKKPSEERGPNDRIAIRQPHMMIMPGVRQLMRDVAASRVVMDEVPGSLKFRKRTSGSQNTNSPHDGWRFALSRVWKKYLGLAGLEPNRNFRIDRQLCA